MDKEAAGVHQPQSKATPIATTAIQLSTYPVHKPITAMFKNLETRSDVNLLSMYTTYKYCLRQPMGKIEVCGIALEKIIAAIEFELMSRIPGKHLWQIEILQRNNNITPTI